MTGPSVSHDTAAPHDGPIALDGPGLIGWLTTDARVRDRTIADGRQSVAYHELDELLRQMDRLFTRAGVPHNAQIALECSQSVSGAIAILHALGRCHDVVLLPDLADRAKEAGTPRFIPSFCSHIVTTSAVRESSGFSVEASVACAANPGFVPDPVVAGFTGPDFYLRTSGSTGTPKLARMSHQKWLNNAMACVERWTLRSDDRLSVPVPIFHSYGFGAAFLPGLLAGAAMDILSRGDIVTYLNREARFEPNVAFLTPSMCDVFVSRRTSPRAYRITVTAGDRIKRETMAGFERRFGPLLNLYGSAEMGAVSAASPDDPPDRRLATAGYPLRGIELRTVDAPADGGALAGAGAGADASVGILQCRQRNGLAGYLIQEERWRFEPRSDNSWFQMGDLARIRADDYVEILGRHALSIKRDGLLVAFSDVEAALETIDGVQRAIVIAAGETARGVGLVGVCLADAGRARPEPAAVRQRCLAILPRYAAPDDIVIVDAWPTLSSGKIDRRALQESIAKSLSSSVLRGTP